MPPCAQPTGLYQPSRPVLFHSSGSLCAPSVAAFVAVVGYFYANNNNDSFEYWDAMQTGGIPEDNNYDYDDDDDIAFEDE